MSATGAALATLPAADPISQAGNTQLVIACLVGIAVIVVLISWLKMHPFLALILGSAALAAVAWIAPTAALTSFINGFGSTAGAVGILIALDGPGPAFEWATSAALADGATAEELVGVLVTAAPLVGSAHVVSSAPRLARALGYDIDAALERMDPEP